MKTIRTMKRTTILVVVLLLGGMTLQAAVLTMAQTGGPGSAPYTVEPGTAASGGYQLTSLRWHVTGAAIGGNYRLSIPDRPALRGNGCCCTFLPLVLRNK